MKHTDFEEKNFVFLAPKDLPECSDLSAHVTEVNGERYIFSVWEIEKSEMIELLFSRRIYLQIIGGMQPPVALMAVSPFREESEMSEARAESFKQRLIKNFILDEYGLDTDYQQLENDIPEAVKSLRAFLDYLTRRGE